MLGFSVALAYLDTVLGIALGVLGATLALIPRLVSSSDTARGAHAFRIRSSSWTLIPPLAVISALYSCVPARNRFHMGNIANTKEASPSVQ